MWVTREEHQKVQHISAILRVEPEKFNSHEIDQRIKEQLTQELVRELYKQDCIQYMKRNAMETFTDEYTAHINVAEPGITDVMMSEYTYEVQGQVFTHDLIEKAILNTFPEMFL